MEPIVYIDRTTGKQEVEKVYGEAALNLLYGKSILSKVLGTPLVYALCRYPFFSSFYGFLQKQPWSCAKIRPFIDYFQIDTEEFLCPATSFTSFNDFFIRELKPEVRPIADSPAIIPADARYFFHQDIHLSDGFIVKGEKFDLVSLIGDKELAVHYERGSMVMARLCPTDYHRFHFPCDNTPSHTRFINGWLYSVNPIALKKDIHIFTQNKRTICELETTQFGKVLFMEIGATNVGSIHETYRPNHFHKKGAEKGYFSFGASSLIILFEPERIRFENDLVDATKQGLEIRCLMGQSMGRLFAGSEAISS